MAQFFRSTERPDWSTFDIPKFFRCAEAVDWAGFDIAEFFHCVDWDACVLGFFVPAELITIPVAPVVDHPLKLKAATRAPAGALASSHSISQQRRKSAKWSDRKSAKKTVPLNSDFAIDSRSEEVSKGQFSNIRWSGLRAQSSQTVISAFVGNAITPCDGDPTDEVDNEPEVEQASKISTKDEHNIKHERDAQDTERDVKDQSSGKDTIEDRPSPRAVAEQKIQNDTMDTARTTAKDAETSTANITQTATEANTQKKHKPTRRSRNSARKARRAALEEEREQQEADAKHYADLHKTTLDGAVTYRISGPWKIPVCPPETLAQTYPPHIAGAYPSPPSGMKPTRKSDLLRQRRHGRVKPFLGKQQYPTKEVTVLGHDMRAPVELLEKYREGKRVRGAAMDKRRERNKESGFIDHLLIPLKAKIGDISLELVAIVEHDAAEAAAKAAAANLSQTNDDITAPLRGCPSARPPAPAAALPATTSSSPPALTRVISAHRTSAEAGPTSAQDGGQACRTPANTAAVNSVASSGCAPPHEAQRLNDDASAEREIASADLTCPLSDQSPATPIPTNFAQAPQDLARASSAPALTTCTSPNPLATSTSTSQNMMTSSSNSSTNRDMSSCPTTSPCASSLRTITPTPSATETSLSSGFTREGLLQPAVFHQTATCSPTYQTLDHSTRPTTTTITTTTTSSACRSTGA